MEDWASRAGNTRPCSSSVDGAFYLATPLYSIFGLWYSTFATLQDELQGIQQCSLLSSQWLEKAIRKGLKTGLCLAMFCSKTDTISGRMRGNYEWPLIINSWCVFFIVWKVFLLWQSVDVQQLHALFFCWIHHLGPTINIALNPAVLILTAHQLWLSGTVTEFV